MTSDQFERLLCLLDADREQAGEKYEDIRRRLVRLFLWSDCSPAEDLADKVFDRVGHKLESSDVINIEAFIFGVAKNVRREFYRRPQPINIEDLAPGEELKTEHLERRIIDEAEERRRRACLRKCILSLPDTDRSLFLEYEYYAQLTVKIELLAQRLNMTLGALRTKAHRIKRRVEVCVLKCFHEHVRAFIRP